MYASTHHLNALMESLMGKINRLARVVLVKGNCTDPDNHAPEVVNDIYLRVRKFQHKLHSPEHVIYSITKNTASTHAARCRREAPDELDDDATPLFTAYPLDPRDMLEMTIFLKELLAKLDDLDRKIFDLRFQDYSYEEMAAILEVDSGTLRCRYSRAVQRLRAIVSPSVLPHIQQPVVTHND